MLNVYNGSKWDLKGVVRFIIRRRVYKNLTMYIHPLIPVSYTNY